MSKGMCALRRPKWSNTDANRLSWLPLCFHQKQETNSNNLCIGHEVQKHSRVFCLCRQVSLVLHIRQLLHTEEEYTDGRYRSRFCPNRRYEYTVFQDPAL